MTELSPDARKLLQQARAAYTPTADKVDAVRVALDAQVAAAGTASVASATGPVGTGSAAWVSGSTLKWVAVLVLAAGASIAAVWLNESPPAPAPLRPTSTDVVVSKRLPVAVPTPVESPTVELRTVHPVPAVEQPAKRAQAKVKSAKRTHLEVNEEQRTGPSALSRSTTAMSVPAAPSGPAGQAAKVVPRAETLEPFLVPEPAVAPARVTDTLAQELPLLRSARAALDRGDALLALQWLQRHTMRYPTGVLRQERIAARVVALCALGRAEDAVAAARQLARIAPSSPHLARLRGTCVGDASL